METRKRLNEIVESAIADFGGEPVKTIVLWHLRNRFHLEPADAVYRPSEFVRALKEIYGAFEEAVEQHICRKIADEYGIDYEGGGLAELAKRLREL